MLEVCVCGRSIGSSGNLRPGSPSVLQSALDESSALLGETLSVPERVLISPAAGIFEPLRPPVQPGPIDAGIVVGTVAGQAVRSPFGGNLLGILVYPGERVHQGQRIAWLRTDS
jgi:[acyl-carrier-protein] S-malonyltransferase